MRIVGKHFEQVPLEEIEAILREAAEQAKRLERSPELVSLLERQASTEIIEEEGGVPSKDDQ
jgi:hypothetical protein